MERDNEIYSAGECPVCPGFGALLFVKDAFGGRVFVFCPACGVAWREVPPAFELNEVLTPADLAPTGLQIATRREIDAAGMSPQVSQSFPMVEWESVIAEFLAS